MPDCRRDEVLDGEADHLREVGEGRLAAVVLPVGVADERGGGVEGDVPGAGVEPLGVERLDPLRPQDHVEDDEEDRAEHDRGLGVGLPVLLAFGPQDRAAGRRGARAGRARAPAAAAARCRRGPCRRRAAGSARSARPGRRRSGATPARSQLLTPQQRIAEVREHQHRDDEQRRPRLRSYPVEPVHRQIEGGERDQGDCDRDEIHLIEHCAPTRQGRVGLARDRIKIP